MANLRTAIDAAFWDLNVSTSRTLDGMVRPIPGDPIPMDGARASRVLRIQQLSLLGNGFPLGLVPSFSPPSKKELGPLALQTVFFKTAISKWWVGLVGQVRPKKLISKLKAEIEVIKADIRKITDDDDWEFELPVFLPIFKNLHKCFLDKSFYSLGVNSHIPLTDSSSILLSMEQPGEEGCRRMKAMYMHKLSDHDVTLEAAWPERFIDHKGRYWEIPESISLDCSSLEDLTGWKYRFGIHKNSGQPVAVDNSDDAVHPALMPGLCAKGAVSYEKHKDLWREVEREKDVMIRTEKGLYFRPAYDVRLREPHAKISGIIGGTFAAWVGGGNNSLITESREDRENTPYSRRRPLGVDLFGSFCYTLQHGKFRKRYNDLTRIDARLDVSSAVAIAKRVSRIFRSASNTRDSLSTPRLNLIFQQQVAGPIVFRLDSRFCIDSIYGVPVPKLEDYVLSLNYSLRLLHSGKVVAWYSPKRKEAMVELRLFEF
ncbi:PREDICTED: protein TRIGALACTOSYLDIACYLGLYCEROL 4, chloroplastic [Ipomoea nil]|uniref:protein TRIGALACTOSYLDIACYLGLYCEROL 4, chloroplastic n=1 Tax=Ipomoea nil TaxID=35883 RepID=UPI000901BCEC|nr:PREDICTED: protein TRIGALACTOSYLDIACYLGLYCEROL 4, chloroplastic [Ipomoea nil]